MYYVIGGLTAVGYSQVIREEDHWSYFRQGEDLLSNPMFAHKVLPHLPFLLIFTRMVHQLNNIPLASPSKLTFFSYFGFKDTISAFLFVSIHQSSVSNTEYPDIETLR